MYTIVDIIIYVSLTLICDYFEGNNRRRESNLSRARTSFYRHHTFSVQANFIPRQSLIVIISRARASYYQHFLHESKCLYQADVTALEHSRPMPTTRVALYIFLAKKPISLLLAQGEFIFLLHKMQLE